MPRFATPDPDDDNNEPKPAQDEVRAMNNSPPLPPPPIRAANNPPVNSSSSQIPVGTFAGGMNNSTTGTNQNQHPAVGLAQAEIDAMIAKHQMAKQDEHWSKTYWRPAMGWLYMAICAFDFIIFPLLSIVLPIFKGIVGVDFPYTTWQPLTLSNGGLIHMAFGAILGVAAWTRGQEKIAGRA